MCDAVYGRVLEGQAPYVPVPVGLPQLLSLLVAYGGATVLCDELVFGEGPGCEEPLAGICVLGLNGGEEGRVGGGRGSGRREGT